jgi:hypothetical protein
MKTSNLSRATKDHDDGACTRRRFIKAGSAFTGTTMLGGAGAGLTFGKFAQAAELAPANRCFVFLYFGGGWDQLLAFDPRDPDVFTPDRIADTRILPAYNLINDASYPDRPVVPTKAGVAPSRIAFGPAIGDLAEHYDLMTVVRGINMTTLGHDVGYRYFLTGKAPIGSAARGSSTATEIVGQMRPRVPIPSIAYGVESYNDRYAGFANALKVSRASDMILALSPSPVQFDSEIEKQLVDLRGQRITREAQMYDSRGLVKSYGESRDQMGTVLANKLDQSFRFERPENADIRATYRLPATGPYDSAAGRAALVATALKKGISQCVSMSIAGGLDTHFGTQLSHANNLRGGFNAVAALVSDLRSSPHPGGGNFMDHTTILLFSEFARTPLVNNLNGRDHHLTSSCAIIGAGVKHNFAFGRSGDIGMSPGVIDHRTGEPDPKGRNIFPEEIVATILASAGLDYSITRTDPIRALLA